MCIKITDEPLKREAMWFSITGFGIALLSQFRNQNDSKSNLEVIARRAVTGLGYAILCVASVVEIVARVALSLFLLIPCFGLSFVGRELEKLYEVPLVLGFTGLFGADTTIRCLSAFVQNVYRERIEFHDLALVEI